MSPAQTYDFVVVGSGPAGSALAAGLAQSAARPQVLLLEAGDDKRDRNLRVDGQRWITFQNQDMNWGYKTTPQDDCNNREIDYSRGHCMGGSSAINFGVYSVGARDDYDEWARITGDGTFAWNNMHRRFKELETFHGELPHGVSKRYADPKAEDHGSKGALHVGYAKEWEQDLTELLDVFEEAGFPLNPDHNSGNPIGMSVLINSAHNGIRSTAGDFVKEKLDNLTIITGAPVQRVLLEGTKAIGVEAKGDKYFTSKEVILSAGSLNDPRILMHSGIGPAAQLKQYNLPVVLDVPGVGQGLRDHCFVPLVNTRTETSTQRKAFYGDKAAMDAALKQWQEDGTGPWAKFACEIGIGWFKLGEKLVSSPEFQGLPREEQEYLLRETIPHYEIITHFPIHWFIPDFPTEALNYSCLLVFLFNAQTRGEVTLQSSDPDAPLAFNPKFLAHPFDRRLAIEALRDSFRIAKHEAYTKDNVAALAMPTGESDEEMLEYWRQNISSSWHMTGTVKMGQKGDPDAVVDPDFKVMGIENLRVADMAVVPVLVNAHIQACAYITGVTCAEKLIKEYHLA
ncbi:Glucose-methanol-choline oxidoreductase [Penicillium ucsense]|uniref:Glucose-methanol-choline oxidoreductase n=1 Tax=Penicillium ucsense TaxID=2839758 RepID=A0A8J8W9L0_9EURO|nr:Glucose-methanol-choline oxidoreductase [Penicillium ucsense]KAF7739111.1 Glucose-methanol-choline oxidoreductase [Penicillium ucsense]